MTNELALFNGHKLREARVYRGLTQTAVAERIGVTPSALSQFESSTPYAERRVMPRPETLARLAEELQFPPSFFLSRSIESGETPVHWRSRSAATKKARDSVLVQINWFRDIVNLIEEHVELPHFSGSALPASTKPPVQLSDEEIEEIAHGTRKALNCGSGPIPNMIQLLESVGCIVSRFSFGAEALSGVSQICGARPIIFLNSDNASACRSRFDAAHELGHIILHSHPIQEQQEDASVLRLMEFQAHRFASSFLFPADEYARRVYSVSVSALIDIKRQWKTSIQMLVMRGKQLGFISDAQYEHAFRELSRRGYRLWEPLDDEIPAEVPIAVPSAIRLMLDEHVAQPIEIATRLGLPIPEVARLTHLPESYFAPVTNSITLTLRDRRPSDTSPSRESAEAKAGAVINFPKR